MKKRYGQHFLRDRTVIHRIIDAINPTPADTLLEIGPGDGALTAPLLDSGARLTAIEIDRDCAAQLRHRFGPRLQIITADILTLDLPTLTPAPTRLIGNLPYNISTPLLHRIAAAGRHLTDSHIMLQKEVSDRLTARPATPEYGRLTIHLTLTTTATPLFDIPPVAFHPPPQINSTFLRLHPLANPPSIPANLPALIRAAFQQRRKTLRNALTHWQIDWPTSGIDSGKRAGDLTPQDYLNLATKARPPGPMLQ